MRGTSGVEEGKVEVEERGFELCVLRILRCWGLGPAEV